ncbi:MAG: hypothetical protein GY719_01485 [bacterium]|nr:hypothetical protein [bacterium]
MSRSKTPPSRLARAVRILLWTLLFLEVLYLVGANVFLNTFLHDQAINKKPEKWTLGWESGWTLIPARLHLNALTFERHGRGQEVRAEADRVDAAVSLWALAGRRFLVDGMKVEGFALDVQRHPKAGEEPQRAEKPGGWRIELRDVELVDVRGFTFDDFVTSGGEARVAGDFAIQVRGDVAAPRAVLEWRDASLLRGEEVLAEPLTMTFDGNISPFAPGREKGFAVLDHLNGSLGVEGTVSRLSILKRFFARAKWIETFDGHGQLRADLEIDEGRIGPGSELDAVADGLRLDYLGYATEGSGKVVGTVEAAEGDGVAARMEVTFADFTLRRKPAVDPYIQGEGFRLVATSSDPDLRDGMTDLDVVLDMPEAEVPNMAVYGALLPADLGVTIDSGSGVASLHLRGSVIDQTASGYLALSAEKIGGHFQDLDFEANLRMDTKISGGDLDDFRLEIQGTRLALTDGVFIDDRNTREKDWWMTIDVAEGVVELGDEPRLTAEVDIGMRDSRPVIALFAEMKAWLQRFERILTVKDVWVHGNVARERDRWSLRDLSLEGRKLEGLAEIEMGEGDRRGILYLRFHGIPIGLELEGTERDWKVTGVKKWYEKKVAESWADGASSEEGPAVEEPPVAEAASPSEVAEAPDPG